MPLPETTVSAVNWAALSVLFPFAVHLIRERGAGGFAESVGLFGPGKRGIVQTAGLALLLLGLMLICSLPLGGAGEFPWASLQPAPAGPDKAASRFAALLGLLIAALLQYGLAEELFFRGFIGRWLISLVGFQLGNAVQSFLYAIVQLALQAGHGQLTGTGSVCILAYHGGAGLLLGWFKEKRCGGSIVPGICAHAFVSMAACAPAVWQT